MRRRHFPTSSHGCFSWRNSATALFCHFPGLLARLYENGPPVMLMGIMESLSESARKTSDWPVLYSTPDTGILSTRTRSSVGSNATLLLCRFEYGFSEVASKCLKGNVRPTYILPSD